MSDALTDIARDQQRQKMYEEFLDALAEFAREPSDDGMRTVAAAAARVDAIAGGYFSGSTGVGKQIKPFLKHLRYAVERNAATTANVWPAVATAEEWAWWAITGSLGASPQAPDWQTELADRIRQAMVRFVRRGEAR